MSHLRDPNIGVFDLSLQAEQLGRWFREKMYPGEKQRLCYNWLFLATLACSWLSLINSGCYADSALQNVKVELVCMTAQACHGPFFLLARLIACHDNCK